METTRVNRWQMMGRWAAMFMLALGGFGFAAATDVMAGTLNGFVKRPNDNPLANVTVSVTGLGTQTTSPAGSFSYSLANSGTYTVTPQLAGHRFTPSSITFTVANGSGCEANFTATREIRGDFDNAFAPASDLAVWRPSSGNWYVQGGATIQFGASTDIPAPGDFDGDGKTDTVVFRPSTGIWHVRNSSNGAYYGVQWGVATDIPVVRDYTGDGKADYAVYRPSNGYWYVLDSVNFASSSFQFSGWTSNDKPVPGYYDDDGKADFAVFRNSAWYVQNSASNTITVFTFGQSGDKPVPADYDGDLKTDFALFRPSNSTWYIHTNGTNYYGIQFGLATDKLAPADYDGDGKADVAVFRPGTGNTAWYIQQSSAGGTTVSFTDMLGQETDLPIAAAYIPAQ